MFSNRKESIEIASLVNHSDLHAWCPQTSQIFNCSNIFFNCCSIPKFSNYNEEIFAFSFLYLFIYVFASGAEHNRLLCLHVGTTAKLGNLRHLSTGRRSLRQIPELCGIQVQMHHRAPENSVHLHVPL